MWQTNIFAYFWQCNIVCFVFFTVLQLDGKTQIKSVEDMHFLALDTGAIILILYLQSYGQNKGLFLMLILASGHNCIHTQERALKSLLNSDIYMSSRG